MAHLCVPLQSSTVLQYRVHFGWTHWCMLAQVSIQCQSQFDPMDWRPFSYPAKTSGREQQSRDSRYDVTGPLSNLTMWNQHFVMVSISRTLQWQWTPARLTKSALVHATLPSEYPFFTGTIHCVGKANQKPYADTTKCGIRDLFKVT